MALSRSCDGDDEIREGNKVGLCTTILRTARDDDGVKLDPKAAEPCVAAVKKELATLPDIRTLQTLVERFEACRTLLSKVPSLTKVEPVTVGAKKADEACDGPHQCSHELYCPEGKGERKVHRQEEGRRKLLMPGSECLGRCSKQEGNKCVSYCGSG